MLTDYLLVPDDGVALEAGIICDGLYLLSGRLSPLDVDIILLSTVLLGTVLLDSLLAAAVSVGGHSNYLRSQWNIQRRRGTWHTSSEPVEGS